MASFHIIRANLTRRPVRSLLTVLSVATAFTLFGLLGALRGAYEAGIDYAGADRLLVVNKISITKPLPLRYQAQIEEIPGVRSVAHFSYFGAYHQDPKQDFFAAATEADKLFDVYSNWEIDEQTLQAWLSTKTGVIIGQGLADRFGFQPGDRIPVGSLIFPKKGGARTWEFTVVGTFDGGGDPSQFSSMFLRHDYFDEVRGFGQGGVAWYVVRIDDPRLVDEVSAAIDEVFTGSSAETKTSSERSWQQGFARQFGNISLMVANVLVVVFLIIVLVVGQTMTQSVQERTSEIAVMRTIGFSARRIFGMVVGESVLLALLGGAAGLTLAAAAAELLRPVIGEFVPGFSVQLQTFAAGSVTAVLLGLVTGMLPALRAMRLDVAAALIRRE